MLQWKTLCSCRLIVVIAMSSGLNLYIGNRPFKRKWININIVINVTIFPQQKKERMCVKSDRQTVVHFRRLNTIGYAFFFSCVLRSTSNINVIKHSPWRITDWLLCSFHFHRLFQSRFRVIFFFFFNRKNVAHAFTAIWFFTITIFRLLKFRDTLVIPIDYFAISFRWINA